MKCLTTTARLCLSAGAMIAMLMTVSQSCEAQLPQDVRDVFEGMLDSLEDDVRQRFQKAINDDTSQVEFTPKEFKKFRDNPANPFEGLEKIAVANRKRNIILNFELPSMRNRPIDSNERQSFQVLAGLDAPVADVRNSTAKFFSGRRPIALGAIVQSDGLIVTKLSEIETRDNIQVQLSNGSRFSAVQVAADQENDLAIVKIDATQLPVVQWSGAEPLLGAFLLTPSIDRRPLAIGSYSVRPRSTREGEQAFLGVQPIVTETGVQVTDIQRGSASYAAGLRNGDVIISLAGQVIFDVPSLVKAIRQHRPGDEVEIDYSRQGAVNKTLATLAGAGIGGQRAARFKMMNRLGAVPSRRDGDFPNVFQHDTPLFPEQCGGPIVDLEGRVVGLNIARKGRAASYALPSRYVATLIETMKQNITE